MLNGTCGDTDYLIVKVAAQLAMTCRLPGNLYTFAPQSSLAAEGER
jgi:hypothetical protein